jgi:ECF transporter S component (folate family)
MQKMTTQKMCLLAVLCAMQVVLSRIAAINVGDYLKISFGFIPIAVCGILAGPMWAALTAAASDVIGALLFPTGAFFPGYTVVAAAGGLIYGLFLYRKQESLIRCLLCTLAAAVVCNLIGNTLCMCLTGILPPPNNATFWPRMGTRALKNLVQFPVNGLILFGIWKGINRIPEKMRKF